MKKENIKISGHVGTWYVIDETFYCGEKVYLLEHETYGDEAACLIVNESWRLFLMMFGTAFLIWKIKRKDDKNE